MSLQEIMEEYGSLIVGIIVVSGLLLGIAVEFSASGVLHQFMEEILSACMGGIMS